MASILFKYNTEGVSQLWLTTKTGTSASYGNAVATDLTVMTQFSKFDQQFFGFLASEELENELFGREHDHLLQIGIVSYNYVCVRDEKSRLGNYFVWYTPDPVTGEPTNEIAQDPIVLEDVPIEEGTVTVTEPEIADLEENKVVA